MKGKIVVTGGVGYIGSHTTVELQQAGYEVIIVDNLSNSNEEVLTGIEKITGICPFFEKIDCTYSDELDRALKKYTNIQGVIHFAASKAVGESIHNPLLYYRNNLVSLLNLLEFISKYQVKGIVFSSSCTVYGQPQTLPVDETAPIQPAFSPYGNTKQINEEIIRDHILSGVSYRGIILRYFNPIGAHSSVQIGELPIGIPQNLVPFLTQTAIGIRKELFVFGNDYNTPDGSCIRDYIHVVDLAKAHVVALKCLLNHSLESSLEYFNIGIGQGISVLELIHAFEKYTGVNIPYRITERRPGDIAQIWANTVRANKLLGWRAEKTIEEALCSAWEWQLRQNY